MKNLFANDHELYTIIKHEEQRAESCINLIASENYTSPAILEASSSVLTNKYAEGYPGKRYYGGCQMVDQAEQLAIERCKQLFGAQHANVQPHAGSQANMGVYFAALKPGDTIMGMSLNEGGHLTHGHSVNFSGSFYKVIQYKVNPETELLDYDAIQTLALEHKPKLIICGASAYSRTIDFARFATIAKQCGALLMADIAHIAGLIAAKVHPSPLPHADFVTSTTHKTLRGPRGAFILSNIDYAEKIDRAIMPGIQGGPLMHTIAAKATAFHLAAQPEFAKYQKQVIANAQCMAETLSNLGYRIVAGGTDNHLFVVDLSTKNITGLQAQLALEKAQIIVSRSCIPFDRQRPWITSGIRLGSPAITTRGMGIEQVLMITHFIDEIIKNADNEKTIAMIGKAVQMLCKQYPIYPAQTYADQNKLQTLATL